MPDSKITAFLAALVSDEGLLAKFKKNKKKTLEDNGFPETDPFSQAIAGDKIDKLKELIGGQQGIVRGSGRVDEANQLAKRAADLTKSSVDLATSWAAFAEASSSGERSGKKSKKKR